MWLADRNFCVLSFRFRLQRQGAAFVIRWHAQNCPFADLAPLASVPGSTQGALEQSVQLTDPDTGERMTVRRIVLPLAKRARSGDAELIRMTTLPPTVDVICAAYRDRWQIETHFQRLTQQLHCEPPALDMPRMARRRCASCRITSLCWRFPKSGWAWK